MLFLYMLCMYEVLGSIPSFSINIFAMAHLLLSRMLKFAAGNRSGMVANFNCSIFRGSKTLHTCIKNCCYHFIVVLMEWFIQKVHCINIEFYLQIKWDGSSEGECMHSFLGSIPRFSTEFICVPNSHYTTTTFQNVDKYFAVQIGMVAKWQGVGLVNRRSWVQIPSVPC